MGHSGPFCPRKFEGCFENWHLQNTFISIAHVNIVYVLSEKPPGPHIIIGIIVKNACYVCDTFTAY